MRCPSPLSRPLPAGLWRWQSAFRARRGECVRARRRGSACGRERFEPQNMRCPSPLSRPLPAGLWRWQSAFRARRGAEESAQSLPICDYPAGENIACGARENPSALFYSCGMAGFVDGGPSIPRRIAQYRAGLRSRSRAVRALFCHVPPDRMCVSAPDRRLKASGASAGAIGCSSIESECAAHIAASAGARNCSSIESICAARIAASAGARNCSSIESGCAAHIAASAGARDCSSIESGCAAHIAASAGARNCSSIESICAAHIERFRLEKRRIAVKY